MTLCCSRLMQTCFLLAGNSCESQNVVFLRATAHGQPPVCAGLIAHIDKGSPARVCARHHLSVCPVCNAEEYVTRRLKCVISGALKRLNLKKKMSYLDYLGANSWHQVLDFLQRKRNHWNAQNPDTPMTLTNTALDHIKPVSSFKRCSVSAQTLLCNHYTNLQPLLLQDNTWKANYWSPTDEKYWHTNIIMQPLYKKVFYPHRAPAQPSLLDYTKTI